jgi:hypothetical protein
LDETFNLFETLLGHMKLEKKFNASPEMEISDFTSLRWMTCSEMREFKRIITHSLVQNIKEIAEIKIEH